MGSTAPASEQQRSSDPFDSAAPALSVDAVAAAHMLGLVLLGACAGWLLVGVGLVVDLLAS
jgi:hypothetical protein